MLSEVSSLHPQDSMVHNICNRAYTNVSGDGIEDYGYKANGT